MVPTYIIKLTWICWVFGIDNVVKNNSEVTWYMKCTFCTWKECACSNVFLWFMLRNMLLLDQFSWELIECIFMQFNILHHCLIYLSNNHSEGTATHRNCKNVCTAQISNESFLPIYICKWWLQTVVFLYLKIEFFSKELFAELFIKILVSIMEESLQVTISLSGIILQRFYVFVFLN